MQFIVQRGSAGRNSEPLLLPERADSLLTLIGQQQGATPVSVHISSSTLKKRRARTKRHTWMRSQSCSASARCAAWGTAGGGGLWHPTKTSPTPPPPSSWSWMGEDGRRRAASMWAFLSFQWKMFSFLEGRSPSPTRSSPLEHTLIQVDSAPTHLLPPTPSSPPPSYCIFSRGRVHLLCQPSNRAQQSSSCPQMA